MKKIPEIMGTFRSHIIEVPDVIRKCSGVRIFGKRVKSFIFTTDVAIIKNTDADAVMSVYPFTPQPVITQSLVSASDVPVFCGVGGGTTTGKRVVNLALDAEFKGAMGVVLNSPTSNETIRAVREVIDIPIVITIISDKDDFEGRLEAGATIFNVSGAKDTARIVRVIRERYPDLPIIATGGPTDESILETIEAGANAITWTPPSGTEIMRRLMEKYRGDY
ncbi:hydrolase [Youngiibacter multivorans]|uniref:Voltage-gated potassium channel Kch n=1 Tax=Youngiibacter multivorans TaxID=937251 RepID=A0ABS4G2Z4_9CLOT|nr:hydrolase [Youngiibacter multivorans]MBP1918909.1 voltage-gated potassium channel Kch [Youngiibacter multivorans]